MYKELENINGQQENLVTPEKVEITEQAASLQHLTIGDTGSIIDLDNGQPAEELSYLISRCKYGDLDAADELAGKIAEEATTDINFINFLIRAQEENRVVFITSHGVYNVPTASKLILDSLSESLNIWLSAQGMQNLLVDMPIPNLIRDEFEDERIKNPRPRGLIDNGKFKDYSVIFVDDMRVSSDSAERIHATLTENGKAEDVFFLYGAILDPVAYETTNRKFEEMVSRREIDGSLEKLLPMLQQPETFTVVQRTLKAVLDPDNKDRLDNYFKLLPDGTLKKLYRAASHADFTRRFNGTYRSTTAILRETLVNRGWVSPETGALYRKKKFQHKEIEDIEKPHRIITKHLNSRKDITIEEARQYSRMKYGDNRAIREVADKMALSIQNDPELQTFLETKMPLIITSSAYGEVPTAATYLTDHIEEILRTKGVDVRRIKIDRLGQFAKQDFGKLSEEHRQAAMKARKLQLRKEFVEVVNGATVMVIDDLCATGSHERAIHSLLHQYGVKKVFTSYYINFSEQIRINDPDVEEWLNRAQAKTTRDLIHWLDGETFGPNARMLKFVLTTKAEESLGITENKRIADLNYFLDSLDNGVLRKLYEAAVSADGYCYMSDYAKGFSLLEAKAIEKGAIETNEVNRIHGRVVYEVVTLDHKGKFIRPENGEELDQLVKEYSLMKFGSPNEIKKFGRRIAIEFIEQLSSTNSELRRKFEDIREKGEYVSLFVPGSRNVPSASNFVMEEAIRYINISLALEDLPTIIIMNLPRLESNTANYAQLSNEERGKRPPTTKTLLPGPEFYKNPMHIIFGDDVRISGTTAERVRQSALENGALSVSEVYGLMIEPQIGINQPEIEDSLNSFQINGTLNEDITYIVNQERFKPVQRLVRLILDRKNQQFLYDFAFDHLNDKGLIELYKAALGNDYAKNDRYSESVKVLRKVMFDRGLVDINGLLL